MSVYLACWLSPAGIHLPPADFRLLASCSLWLACLFSLACWLSPAGIHLPPADFRLLASCSRLLAVGCCLLEASTIAIARIQHIGVGTRGGAFIVPRERSKRTRTCLLQGTTIATARIQTGLYIMLSEAARVNQESALRIFVVCKPHVRSHAGEHDQPAQMCFFTSAVQIDKKMVACAPFVPTTSTMPP